MRVISGSAKGYGLKAPRRMGLRPTPSRVKEAIFSSMGNLIPNANILELFAGTGAFGIEALSRGGHQVTLVEKDRRAVTLIQENLQKTRLQDRARVLHADTRQALEWLQKDRARFDIIFADPPYFKGEKPDPHKPFRSSKSFSWTTFLLNSEILPKLLQPHGILLIEYFKKETGIHSPHWALTRQFRFGDTIVSIFKNPSALSALDLV